jgi:hypothetical protein
MIQFAALRSVQSVVLAMALLAGWSALSPAAQATVKFTKIVQTGDSAPGSTAKFEQFNQYGSGPPAISGSRIAFNANLTGDPALTYALYKFSNGKLQKQLDSNTPVPNTTNRTFGRITDAIAIQGEQIVFNSGGGVFNTIRGLVKVAGGIYSVQNSVVKTIAETDTIAPGAGGKRFSAFAFGGYRSASGVYDVSASDNQVLFSAVASDANGQQSVRGLYVFRNDQLSALIDENTVDPSSGLAASFFNQYSSNEAILAQYEINGPQIAFLPAASLPYRDSPLILSVQPQKLTSLASAADIVPPTFFTSASINRSGALAFSNLVPALYGGDRIFLKRHNRVKLIYQLGQTVQGLRTSPTAVSKACLSGTQVIFNFNTGIGTIDAGLLVSRGDKVSPLIQLEDQLEGKTVSSIFVDKKRYCSGRFFVFKVGFTDNTSAIYRGEILPDMNALVAGTPDEADE